MDRGGNENESVVEGGGGNGKLVWLGFRLSFLLCEFVKCEYYCEIRKAKAASSFTL